MMGLFRRECHLKISYRREYHMKSFPLKLVSTVGSLPTHTCHSASVPKNCVATFSNCLLYSLKNKFLNCSIFLKCHFAFFVPTAIKHKLTASVYIVLRLLDCGGNRFYGKSIPPYYISKVRL